MIINLRGTSGSGKSTVVRSVMEFSPRGWTPIYKDGRKNPLYYREALGGYIAVLGHYETPCGGGDTIGSARQIVDEIKTLFLDNHLKYSPPKVILVEGLLLSEDVKWTSTLPDLRVLLLNTPVEECLKRIRNRRAAVGNDKPLSESNTRNRVATIERAYGKLQAAGVYCRRCASDQAPGIVMKWIQQATGETNA